MTDTRDESPKISPDKNLGRKVKLETKEHLTHKLPTVSLAWNPNDQGDPREQGGLKADAARILRAHEDGAPGSHGRTALPPPTRCLRGLTKFQK